MTYPPEPLAAALDLRLNSPAYVPEAEAVTAAHAWLLGGEDPSGRSRLQRGTLGDAFPDLHEVAWLRLTEVAPPLTPEEGSATTATGLAMLAAVGSPVILVIGTDDEGSPSVTIGLRDDGGVTDAWRANQAPDAIWVPTTSVPGLAVASSSPHQETAMSCRAGAPRPRSGAVGISAGSSLPSALALLLHSAASMRRWCVVLTLRPLDAPVVRRVAGEAVETTRHFARAVNVSSSVREVFSESGVDSTAQRVVETMEAWSAVLADAATGAGWDVATYCCASRPADLRVLAGLMSGVLGAGCARSQEDRTWSWTIEPVTPGGPVGGSWLSSRDVADLLLPPSSSVGSLQVRDRLAGGRKVSAHPRPIRLGQWVGTRIPAAVDLSDLSGHGFVTGMTGSGKSTSTRSLLTQLWNEYGVPWLVIDPAKADYPALAPYLRGGLTVVDGTSLSMNALAPWPGTDPERHVTAVASAFRAAFGLPMPVPYVATLLFDEVASVDGVTLHDVAARLPSLITELGYRGEIEDNIRASLGLRLRLLTQPGRADRLAGAGPPTWLTERPTVVQLGDLADEEERSFITALLVTWVAEAARVRGESSEVRHLTVVEEAHRVMPEPRQTTGDDGDAGAVSARLMTQLLAEVRAYGESVLVIDQSPAAVAREVVRNTNVKVVHRVVDPEDQTALGGAMGLTSDDSRMLGSLAVGRALLSTRDLMRPQTVEVSADRPDPQEGGVTRRAPSSHESLCHGEGGEVVHHRSERLGEVMELEVALWVLAGGGHTLVERTRTHLAEAPGTSTACLVAVGIRRHVATLSRLRAVASGEERDLASRWWGAAIRGRTVTDPHPQPAVVRPMAACRLCPSPCRVRGLVESGALTGLSRHRQALRSASTPTAVAGVANDALGAYKLELTPVVGVDLAVAVGYCAAAHLAHDGGGTYAWLPSDPSPTHVNGHRDPVTEEDQTWRRTSR